MQVSEVESGKVDQHLVGDPFKIGARTIRPFAHLAGWRLGTDSAVDGFQGALLRVTPNHVEVEEAGNQYTIPITNPAAEAIRAIIIAGLGVSAICWLVMLVAHWRAK